TYPLFEASPPDFRTLRERNRTLAGLSASYGANFTLTGPEHPERLDAAIVSTDYFTTLGVKPMLGRAFLPGEEKWGAHHVVVVSEGFWRNRLNADPDISRKLLNLDGEPYQVVGVMPAGFYTTRRSLDLWAPMAWKPNDNADSHNNFFVHMVGRLK